MARPLIDLHEAPPDSAPKAEQSRITRSAAAALAAAISALLIATLVVNRTSGALDPEGTVAASTLSSGTIALVDDDQGRSLFDLSDMAPGRPVVRCIEVVYEGSIVPVDLALRAETVGDLAPFLDVSVEAGTGGGFDTCEGWQSVTPLLSGTLAELAASGWLEVDRIVNTGSRSSYRIEIALQDELDALGRSASASFVWEVTPS